jgi:putative two-component system response regulator
VNQWNPYTRFDPAPPRKAVAAGANDFITKPVDKLELSVRTRSLLHHKALHDDLKQFEAELPGMVETRTLQLHQALADVKNARYETVHRSVKISQSW